MLVCRYIAEVCDFIFKVFSITFKLHHFVAFLWCVKWDIKPYSVMSIECLNSTAWSNVRWYWVPCAWCRGRESTASESSSSPWYRQQWSGWQVLVNLMDIGEFNGRSLYAGLRLDYRLRLWAPTSASHAVSAVAELLVCRTQKHVYVWIMWSTAEICMNGSIHVRPLKTTTKLLIFRCIQSRLLCWRRTCTSSDLVLVVTAVWSLAVQTEVSAKLPA